MKLFDPVLKKLSSQWNAKSFQDGYKTKKQFSRLIYGFFLASLIAGLCFAILYPLIKVLPVVFCDLQDLGNPDVIWIPMKRSVTSFRAAIQLIYGNGMGMLKTLGYSAIIMLINIFVCSMTGYALGRVRFKLSSIAFFLVILTFLVPPQSLLISQYLHFKHFDIFGLIKAFTGDTIDLINKPYTLFIIAFLGFGVKESLFVFILRQFYKGMPTELEEAALIDGCGFHRTYYSIMLPNAVPAIVTVAVLSFVWNYGDTYYTGYFHPDGPYVSNTLTRAFNPSNQNTVLRALSTWYNMPGVTTFAFDAVKQAAVLLYLIPLLVVYFLIQKKLVDNFERSGIVG